MGYVLLRALALFVLTLTVHAQLVFFDFNTDPTSPPATESMVPGIPTIILSGTDVDVTGQEGHLYTDSSGTEHDPGLAGAFQSGVNAGDNTIVFTVDTTGNSSLVLSYDYRSTAFGPTSSTLEYALLGHGFTLLGTDLYSRDAIFNRTTWDLRGVTQLGNAGEVQFRWSNFTGGTGTGTFRMDNLELTTVPEPALCSSVTAAGLLVLLLFRRDSRPS